MFNNTKNQHFVSQTEQKLSSTSRSKIYQHRLRDREAYELEPAKSKSIVNNLSLNNLFSFDIESRDVIWNMESNFQAYESNISDISKSLANDTDELETEQIGRMMVSVLCSKMLNFSRNPFCIPKVINTYGEMAKYYFTDPDLLKILDKIENGKKPQAAHLSQVLGVTIEQYKQWLRILFMLLTPPRDGHRNLLDSLVLRILTNKDLHTSAILFIYDGEHANKHPLISDRSFVDISNSEGNNLDYSFNLTANSFIRFHCLDYSAAGPISENLKEAVAGLNIKIHKNELKSLAAYNLHAIYQCKEYVYSASKDVYKDL